MSRVVARVSLVRQPWRPKGGRQTMANAERNRLKEADARGVPWRRWGPYLSERQWGTVREDTSDGADTWSAFTHDQARSRAYRWGEDGLAGVSDDRQLLCLALALWNGRDPLLKERLFGLTNAEGNHGEDVKECYFYLDATPTSSYLKMLYKYPQAEFPYADLVATNGARGKTDPEYELIDTGIFEENRYFDVVVEYAKAAPEDVLMQVTVHNRGSEDAVLHVLPTLWFRHTWSWAGGAEEPSLHAVPGPKGTSVVRGEHSELGTRWLYADQQVPVLVTGNETNNERVFGSPNDMPFVKDGIDRAVVGGDASAVNPDGAGRGQRDAETAADRHAIPAASPAGPGGHSAGPVCRFRRGDERSARRGRRVLGPPAVRRQRRRAACGPSGAVRDALVAAVLRAGRGALAGRARRRSARRRRLAAQPRVAAPDRRGRHLDAGQMGVPLVRRLGSGVPRGGSRPR